MTPIASQISQNNAQFSFALVDRKTILYDYATLTAAGVFSLANPGSYGNDPILQIPQVAQQYQSAEFVLRTTAQVLLEVGGSVRQLSTGLAGIGFVSSGAQGIVIDGRPFQYAFAPGKDSVKLASMPSTIDLSTVSAVFDFNSAFNNVSFPPTAGVLHSYQVLMFATLICTK